MIRDRVLEKDYTLRPEWVCVDELFIRHVDVLIENMYRLQIGWYKQPRLIVDITINLF